MSSPDSSRPWSPAGAQVPPAWSLFPLRISRPGRESPRAPTSLPGVPGVRQWGAWVCIFFLGLKEDCSSPGQLGALSAGSCVRPEPILKTQAAGPHGHPLPVLKTRGLGSQDPHPSPPSQALLPCLVGEDGLPPGRMAWRPRLTDTRVPSLWGTLARLRRALGGAECRHPHS